MHTKEELSKVVANTMVSNYIHYLEELVIAIRDTTNDVCGELMDYIYKELSPLKTDPGLADERINEIMKPYGVIFANIDGAPAVRGKIVSNWLKRTKENNDIITLGETMLKGDVARIIRDFNEVDLIEISKSLAESTDKINKSVENYRRFMLAGNANWGKFFRKYNKTIDEILPQWESENRDPNMLDAVKKTLKAVELMMTLGDDASRVLLSGLQSVDSINKYMEYVISQIIDELKQDDVKRRNKD